MPMDNISSELEIIEPSAIEAMTKAEIDVQISTAKRYPRSLAKVKTDMMSFACLDAETAAACFYTVPRGGKNIQGPSIRLAEIAISSYGNLRAGSRVVSVSSDGANPHVVIQSVCHDLERNTAITIEKRRRITTKKNKDGTRKPVDEDDINLAVNSCSAVALRDAVFKIIPLALIKPVFDQAKRVATGDAKTLVDRRAKALEHFAKMGVQKDRVLTMLGKTTIEEIDLSDLETLIGLHTAIKDGNTTIDEAFQSQEKLPKFEEGEKATRGKPATVKTPPPPEDGDLGPKVEVKTEALVQTQVEPAKDVKANIWKSISGAGFGMNDLADVCSQNPKLAARANTWSSFEDVSESDAVEIFNNLYVGEGEMKWRSKRANGGGK